MTTDDQAPAAELEHADETPGMAPVMRGQFALYQRPSGALEMFYNIGDGTVSKVLPPAVVAMVMGKGPMAGILRKAFGG